jgi:hypothetical protein
MGRTPLSGYVMLRLLRKHGIETSTVFYSVTFEKFASIESRVRKTIEGVAARGEYVLIGHSLGGMFIRSAISSLPEGTPMPNRVFLLGSPVRPARLAKYFRKNPLFRIVTGECGQVLGSDEQMANIPGCAVPSTSFVGTRGFYGKMSFFGDEVNDGIVSESEIAAPWISEEIRVPVPHLIMPNSLQIANLIVERASPDMTRGLRPM